MHLQFVIQRLILSNDNTGLVNVLCNYYNNGYILFLINNAITRAHETYEIILCASHKGPFGRVEFHTGVSNNDATHKIASSIIIYKIMYN